MQHYAVATPDQSEGRIEAPEEMLPSPPSPTPGEYVCSFHTAVYQPLFEVHACEWSAFLWQEAGASLRMICGQNVRRTELQAIYPKLMCVSWLGTRMTFCYACHAA